MKLRIHALAAVAALFFATGAHAVDTYTLTFADASAGLGTGPFATVTLEQQTANSVLITENVIAPYALIDTGGPHHPFAFNIAGTETIVVSGLPTGFSLIQGSVTNTPFGTFEYGLQCTTCGPGGSNPYLGTLSFLVTSSAPLTTSSFVANSSGYVFSSDVVNTGTGMTGNVAGVAAIPEPETYALMLAGLGLMGYMGKRRKAAA